MFQHVSDEKGHIIVVLSPFVCWQQAVMFKVSGHATLGHAHSREQEM